MKLLSFNFKNAQKTHLTLNAQIIKKLLIPIFNKNFHLTLYFHLIISTLSSIIITIGQHLAPLLLRVPITIYILKLYKLLKEILC